MKRTFLSKIFCASVEKKGFTLAEVLITLGIIGIVAALTIPTLVRNYQKIQYTTAAKKAYSEMNQMLQQMAVANGTIGDVSDYFDGSSSYRAAFASFLKIINTCGTSTADVSCFAPFDNNYDGSAKSVSEWTSFVNTYYKFVTADGMSYAVNSYGSNCTKNYGFADGPDAPTTNHVCGVVYIDINGLKKPNIWGRDVFTFYITSNKTPMLYPSGGRYDNTYKGGDMSTGGDSWWHYNNKDHCGTNGKSGGFCTGRLMEKNWQMDY